MSQNRTVSDQHIVKSTVSGEILLSLHHTKKHSIKQPSALFSVSVLEAGAETRLRRWTMLYCVPLRPSPLSVHLTKTYHSAPDKARQNVELSVATCHQH